PPRPPPSPLFPYTTLFRSLLLMQHRPQRRLQYLVLLLIALNCAGHSQTPKSAKNADAGRRQDFAGSELCAQCHEETYKNFEKTPDRKSTRLNSSHLGISYA